MSDQKKTIGNNIEEATACLAVALSAYPLQGYGLYNVAEDLIAALLAEGFSL